MTEKYEFPEWLRLATDEPIEDDGWGEFSLDSEGRKAQIVIGNMGEFITHYRCLLAPTFDVDKHIAALVKKHICPVGKQRGACPCDEAAAELQRDGCSLCGVFVTERYLKHSQDADRFTDCQEKTKALLREYGKLEG